MSSVRIFGFDSVGFLRACRHVKTPHYQIIAPQAHRKQLPGDFGEAPKRNTYVFLVDDKENNLSAIISPWKLKGFKCGIALVSTVI